MEETLLTRGKGWSLEFRAIILALAVVLGGEEEHRGAVRYMSPGPEIVRDSSGGPAATALLLSGNRRNLPRQPNITS